MRALVELVPRAGGGGSLPHEWSARYCSRSSCRCWPACTCSCSRMPQMAQRATHRLVGITRSPTGSRRGTDLPSASISGSGVSWVVWNVRSGGAREAGDRPQRGLTDHWGISARTSAQGRIRSCPLRRAGCYSRFRTPSEIRADREGPDSAALSDVRCRSGGSMAGYGALQPGSADGSTSCFQPSG